jgi:hypothetical protein
MPIPQWDPQTGCLPNTPKLHDATLDEIEQALVTPFQNSQTRPGIFQAYLGHRDAIQPLVVQTPREQWLDGSFTTNKIDPGDVDVVTWLPLHEVQGLSDEDKQACRELFKGRYTPAGAPVHSFCAFTMPANHPYAFIEQQARAYWTDWFGTQRNGDRKGILRVEIG